MMRLFCLLLAVALLLPGCNYLSTRSSLEGKRSSSESAEVSEVPSAFIGTEPTVPEGEDAPLTFTLTVPEGYTLARIGMLLEEKGVCTVDEFIEIAETADFSQYPLIAQQEPDKFRCYVLEGYLFPDTYEFYSTVTPEAIIHSMLANTEKRITPQLREKISETGYTVDEILTLASIIQKESFGDDVMPNVSSVLHNRLDSGMKLQCDVTITYVEGAIKPFISGDKDYYSAAYNTYRCEALPAGAICNPGLAAIEAAIFPAESDFFFFLTDKDSEYYFAATYEEHLINVDKAGLNETE